MHKIFIVISLLMLASCDHYEEDKAIATAQLEADSKQIEENVESKAVRVANNVRDSVRRTNNRVREWWLTPLPVEEKPVTPTRYCYRVLQDILCYREQMPGWESKLVGYQGNYAEPPTPAVTVVTPLRAENADAHPAKRAENTKPVFVTIPIDPKDAPKVSDAPVIDATKDALPTSALSPQI